MRRTLFARSRDWRWPVVVAMVLTGLAGGAQLGALMLAQKAARLESDVRMALPMPPPKVPVLEEPDPFESLPDGAEFTKDLSKFFRIAQGFAVTLGPIEYRLEENPKLPQLVQRSMEFRVNEGYPKTKAFLSKVLQTLPHAALQEIRVERKDVMNAQGSIQVKLVLLYGAKPRGM